MFGLSKLRKQIERLSKRAKQMEKELRMYREHVIINPQKQTITIKRSGLKEWEVLFE